MLLTTAEEAFRIITPLYIETLTSKKYIFTNIYNKKCGLKAAAAAAIATVALVIVAILVLSIALVLFSAAAAAVLVELATKF